MEHSPLYLLKEFLPKEKVSDIESAVSGIRELPPVLNLGELKTPQYGDDPTELIKHRFLYRGGICLLVGPTGIGKSSLVMQLGIRLSVGLGIFGIEPGDVFREKGMQVLLVQAENDEGDLAEMRNGVLAGCFDLTGEQRNTALSQLKVCSINDQTSEQFASTLDGVLQQHGPFDLLIIDPAFAYLGGDSGRQKDVSRFMRDLLNPLINRHRIGVILAHHTNKPLRGKEKDNWKAGDYAYLGAGSAEWVNASRAVLAVRSLGSDTVFELRASKRGRRLRWKDENGLPTVVRYISHHDDPTIICWREATPEEVEEVLSADKSGSVKCCPEEILHCVNEFEGESQKSIISRIREHLTCSSTTVQNVVNQCVENGWLEVSKEGRENQYFLTPEGRETMKKTLSVISWENDRQK